jgi:hypothetical protein
MPYSNYNYISLISLLVDDEINPNAIDIYNWESFTDLMGIMGRYKESKQPVYHNYVNADIGVQGDTTGASVTGSGTATVGTTFTTGTSGYTFKNQLVIFPNGKVGHVQNVTGTTQDAVTIKSVDGTNLTHTAGQKLDIFSIAVGEASIVTTNKNRPLVKYVNNIQHFRHVNEETDVAKVSITRVSFNGSNHFYSKNLIEKYMELKGWVNGALLGGKISNSLFSDTTPALTDPEGGGAVQTTRGYDQYCTTYGVNDTVASPGIWTLADHGDVIDQLIAKRALISQGYKLVMATKVKGVVDNHLKNLGSSNVNSVRLTGDVNGASKMNFMVDEFSYKGMNAQMAVMSILDNNKMFSQTDIVKSIYYMPGDSVKTLDNGYQSRVQIRYQSHGVGPINKGVKIWAEWHSGPLSPVAGSLNVEQDRLIWRCNWKTNQGLEVLGAEHTAKSVVLA